MPVIPSLGRFRALTCGGQSLLQFLLGHLKRVVLDASWSLSCTGVVDVVRLSVALVIVLIL